MSDKPTLTQFPDGYLSEENIPHNSLPFKRIQEIHDALWAFVRIAVPGASGYLDSLVGPAFDELLALRAALSDKEREAKELGKSDGAFRLKVVLELEETKNVLLRAEADILAARREAQDLREGAIHFSGLVADAQARAEAAESEAKGLREKILEVAYADCALCGAKAQSHECPDKVAAKDRLISEQKAVIERARDAFEKIQANFDSEEDVLAMAEIALSRLPPPQPAPSATEKP